MSSHSVTIRCSVLSISPHALQLSSSILPGSPSILPEGNICFQFKTLSPEKNNGTGGKSILGEERY